MQLHTNSNASNALFPFQPNCLKVEQYLTYHEICGESAIRSHASPLQSVPVLGVVGSCPAMASTIGKFGSLSRSVTMSLHEINVVS